jgi:hypothetical protein
MSTNANPAVEEAKSQVVREDNILEVEGVRIRIKRVSASLIDSVTSRVPDPKVPKFFNDEKGREEENPLHPDYLRALADADKERGMAALDAVLMFGVELVDGLPKDTRWLEKLKLAARTGMIDLTGFDLENDIDLEFLFKKNIMADSGMINILAKATGLTSEDIVKAERSFPGNS